MTAPHEIYSRLLFKEGQGYPLWNPALPADCPQEYELTGTQVGDVGYLSPDGGFIFLFNMLLSKDHPINKWRGVPDNFVPFHLSNKSHNTRYPAFYPPNFVICHMEKGAKSIKGDMNASIPHSSVTIQSKVEHQSSYSKAAALVLRNGASKDDYNPNLSGWAEQNAVSLYRFAITKLGYEVPNGGMYLVTGVTNTDSWYISPFSRKSGGDHASFEVGITGFLSGSLSASTALSVTGSYAPRYSPLNHKGQNQSVFIRGWKMMIRSDLFGRLTDKPDVTKIQKATFSALGKVGPPPYSLGSIQETPMSDPNTLSSTIGREELHVGETREGTTSNYSPSSSRIRRTEPRAGETREGTAPIHNVSSSSTRKGEPFGGEETMSNPNLSSSATRSERKGTTEDKGKKSRKPSRTRRRQSPGPSGPAGRKNDGPGGPGAGGAGQSGGQGSGGNARGGGGQADRDGRKDNEGRFNSGGGKGSVSGRQHGGSTWEKENFSDDSESGDSRADPIMLHPYHPSDVINKYLLQMCPQSEVALTHDDTWCSIFQESDSVILDDEELLERINISYDIHESENKACVFVLRDGSETHSQSPKLEAVDSTIGRTSRDGFYTEEPGSKQLFSQRPGREEEAKRREEDVRMTLRPKEAKRRERDVPMTLRAKDDYTRHLLRLNFGLPLFTPSDVELGDVGFIDRIDGSFRRLYNIAAPDTDIPGHPPRQTLSYGKSGLTEWQGIHMSANSERKIDVSVQPPNAEGNTCFQFSNIGRGDVILIPGDYVRKDALTGRQQGALKAYFETHFNWISETYCLREDISRDELILVVGTTKTNRWGIAVNVNEESKDSLAFVVRGTGVNTWARWSGTVGFEKCGPRDGEPTQTIFINHIQPRGILDKIQAVEDDLSGLIRRIWNGFNGIFT